MTWFICSKFNLNTNLIVPKAEYRLPRMDEMFKAASESSTLLDLSPRVSDAENCAFSSRHGVTTYGYYEQNPTKGARFARSMDAWSKSKF